MRDATMLVTGDDVVDESVGDQLRHTHDLAIRLARRKIGRIVEVLAATPGVRNNDNQRRARRT